MNKNYFIIGLIAILLLGGGMWLLTQNKSPDRVSNTNNTENTIEKENNTANSTNSVGDSSNRKSYIDTEENDSDKVVVYFFWGDGCPHCAKEKPFLEGLEQKYSKLEVKMFEVYYNQDNQELFKEVAQAYGTQARGVPTTFIGDFDPVVGYGSDQTTGKEIEDMIKQCIEGGCINPGSKLE